MYRAETTKFSAFRLASAIAQKGAIQSQSDTGKLSGRVLLR